MKKMLLWLATTSSTLIFAAQFLQLMRNKQNNNGYKQNALIFKVWARKGYSVFATIKRVVVISVLAVAYLFLATLKTGASEKDTSEVKMQYDIDEIEVSASRAPAVYSEIARVLTIIEADEIERAPVESIQELLGYVAATDIRSRGAGGVQADVSIRGGSFDQTIILLNGINITDPQTGHHNLNIPVSLSQIKRIEVLEGPAARVYGPSAFSGAVNIITCQPEANTLRLQLSGGSFNYFNSNLSGSLQTGKMNHMLAANRKSSSGYIDNTDFGISNLFYSGKAYTSKGNISVQLGISEKEFGANSFYSPKYPNQFEETGTFFSAARWKSNSRFHFTPAVYWRRHTDKFMLFRNNPPDWYSNHNYHLTNIGGANVNSWIRWAAGKTAAGAEFRYEGIRSNVLGEEMENTVKVPGEEAFYTHSKNRSTVSLFIDHFYTTNAFSVSAGLMANHISDQNSGWNFFPGIDAGYQLNEATKLVVSFNTSLRMPTFTDLYYSGPTNIGNPDLKPEKSATLESGVKLNKGFARGHFIVFFRKGENMIDWVKQSSDELWQSQNLTQINSRGAEAALNFRLNEKLGKNLPEMFNLSYFYNNQEKDITGYISNYVLDNLKHKFTASVTQRITGNLSVNLRTVFQDREGAFTEFDNGTETGEVSYPPFWLFDGKVMYQSNNLKLTLSASNIFNRSYFDLGNIVQPGRWIKAGVEYQLNFN
ncbi:iron complex outermembrane recepter protein [Tangfeifania diversioriginum]|uniref:Iron complex outermembrane recepter protein n=2 Tax=Tangfeifania diversioriginum TaxID=1168035 RepID=A0A1M6EKC8_9BACT|nr:iron complex outermembrane recepter protein [Tangfeifania diversioriginum]